MSVITLKNRVTTHSDSDVAFASCTALPIHQTTLNAEEMAGIDGLWDWDDFVSEVLTGAVVGAVGGAIVGAGGGAVVGAGAGAIAGAGSYIYGELTD